MTSPGSQSPAGPPLGPGRVYSTWRWDLMCYDYWHDPAGPADVGGWTARPGAARTRPWSAFGDPVENLLSELPKGARHIGQGEVAVGEVAVEDRAKALASRPPGTPPVASGYEPVLGSLGQAESPAATWALVAVLAGWAWWIHKT